MPSIGEYQVYSDRQLEPNGQDMANLGSTSCDTVGRKIGQIWVEIARVYYRKTSNKPTPLE